MLGPEEVLDIALPPAVVSAVIGLLFSISYWYVGKIVNDSQLEQKGKGYLINSIGNFIVIGLLPLLIFLLTTLLGVLGGYGSFDYYTGSTLAILRLEASLRSLYSQLFLTHTFLSVLGGLQVSIIRPLESGVAGSTSWTLNFLGGLDILINKLDDVLIQLIIIYGMLAGRAAMLELAPVLFLALFPFGVLLRGFPWTRKTGSSIIALTLSLYLVYPMTILLSDYILFEGGFRVVGNDFVNTVYFVGIDDSSSDSVDMVTKAIEGIESQPLQVETQRSFLQVAWDVMKGLVNVENVISVLLAGAGSILYTFPDIRVRAVGFILGGLGAAPFLEFLARGASSLIEWSFLMVFSLAYTTVNLMVGIFISLLLEVAITVSAFRALGSILGGETALLGLLRLI